MSNVQKQDQDIAKKNFRGTLKKAVNPSREEYYVKECIAMQSNK